MKQFNKILADMDKVFADDGFFGTFDDTPTKQTASTNTAGHHTHHVDFRARDWKERMKLSLRFMCMSIAILCKGKAQISFKNRSSK